MPRFPVDEMTNIERLLEIMTRLRDPRDGCPWDVEQTFGTIAPYTIEEAYEVADAIERDDMVDLREELGDLLFQVVFHARMAEERGNFDIDQVAGSVVEKMVRRHPHVFGTEVVESADAMTVRWEEQKAQERARKATETGRRESVLDGVIGGLPALTRAVKLQKRAARVGFDWADAAEILDKIEEEIGELRAELATGDMDRMEDELGDLLFALVNLARRRDIDPESALRGTNAKFERRFRRIETLLEQQGRTPENATLAEMEAMWQQAKKEEK